ncbi:DUF6597 domain-containing transcriptional factor [Brevibacillus sp. NRS-1366]|uniref:DUF6597 domain-containing transcriptional factor n=1 Tax=Brevibacillus sp. NRS-1366 TaxID=3233899 RepID=UPI003D26297F
MRLYRPVQPPALQYEPMPVHYRYREYLPCKSLQNYIACYWTVDSWEVGTNHWNRVIPDGCVDIIFDLRAPSFSKGAFVSGLMRSFQIMPVTGHQSLLGIRFFSETAHHFLRYPVSGVTGERLFLEELWGMEASWIVEYLMEATEIADKIAMMEDVLKQRLSASQSRSDRLLVTSIRYMYEYRGNMSISSLAEKVNYSERNLRRTFQNELGVSPKELIRIIQFQSLLQELTRGTHVSFMDLALQYGYYDQSHVIKSFQTLYGVAPSLIFPARKAK